MWCVKFIFETILIEISQNLRVPHFPLVLHSVRLSSVGVNDFNKVIRGALKVILWPKLGI